MDILTIQSLSYGFLPSVNLMSMNKFLANMTCILVDSEIVK